jgi:hypothetical protein
MILIKGNREGGVCRKDELGVTLSPVSTMGEMRGCQWVKGDDEMSHFMQAILTGADTVAWYRAIVLRWVDGMGVRSARDAYILEETRIVRS